MKKRRDSILIACTNLILPILITLGLYIIIHGHLSPGGGFQGGVLIAGALVTIYIGYGKNSALTSSKAKVYKVVEDIGALGFIILAFVGLVVTGTFFTNTFELGKVGELLSSGSIFLMNSAVGLKVFAGISFLVLVMIGLLRDKEDE